jgi:hypothetical protein
MEQTRGGAIVICTSCRYPLFSWVKTPLYKLVLCNPDADASVTVGLQFLSHDRAFDRRDHAFDRSIQKPHDKTDGRRKLHPSGETQIETGRTNVV